MLLPHQERVIEERNDTQFKVERLFYFTGLDSFRSLDKFEQSRMIRQLNIMREYVAVLDERIAAFNP